MPAMPKLNKAAADAVAAEADVATAGSREETKVGMLCCTMPCRHT